MLVIQTISNNNSYNKFITTPLTLIMISQIDSAEETLSLSSEDTGISTTQFVNGIIKEQESNNNYNVRDTTSVYGKVADNLGLHNQRGDRENLQRILFSCVPVFTLIYS